MTPFNPHKIFEFVYWEKIDEYQFHEKKSMTYKCLSNLFMDISLIEFVNVSKICRTMFPPLYSKLNIT